MRKPAVLKPLEDYLREKLSQSGGSITARLESYDEPDYFLRRRVEKQLVLPAINA